MLKNEEKIVSSNNFIVKKQFYPMETETKFLNMKQFVL